MGNPNSGANPRNARGIDDKSVLRKTAKGQGTPRGGATDKDPGTPPVTGMNFRKRKNPGGSERDAHAMAKAMSNRARKNNGASDGPPEDVNGPSVNDGTSASESGSRRSKREGG